MANESPDEAKEEEIESHEETVPEGPTAQAEAAEASREPIVDELWVRDQLAHVRESGRDDIAAIARKIDSMESTLSNQIEIHNRQRFLLGAAAFVLTAVVAYWSAYATLEASLSRQISGRIDAEFATEKLQETIAAAAESAASGHAEKIIKEKIDPAVEQTLAAAEAAKAQVDAAISEEVEPAILQALAAAEEAQARIERIVKQELEPAIAKAKTTITQITVNAETTSNELQVYVEGLKDDYRKDLESLSENVDFMQSVNEIRALKNKAFVGDAVAYDAIRNFRSDNPDLVLESHAAETEIRNLLYGSRKFSDLPVTTLIGEDRSVADLTTDELIELSKHAVAPIRGRTATLLPNGKDFRVVDRLFEMLETDPDLWVRAEAMRAISGIVGGGLHWTPSVLRGRLKAKEEQIRKRFSQ